VQHGFRLTRVHLRVGATNKQVCCGSCVHHLQTLHLEPNPCICLHLYLHSGHDVPCLNLHDMRCWVRQLSPGHQGSLCTAGVPVLSVQSWNKC
jgi:hypothetical protein